MDVHVLERKNREEAMCSLKRDGHNHFVYNNNSRSKQIYNNLTIIVNTNNKEK